MIQPTDQGYTYRQPPPQQQRVTLPIALLESRGTLFNALEELCDTLPNMEYERVSKAIGGKNIVSRHCDRKYVTKYRYSSKIDGKAKGASYMKQEVFGVGSY
ncbi:hypothetical protein HAX54_044691 [Datura stramonium]|uniref:Uncharacterized protein n=1 Tax=Datura stramonium TaxID=4076 RepID=A0ABS8WIU8_DATST|nr:hypothetical protein [Datura stramonium]